MALVELTWSAFFICCSPNEKPPAKPGADRVVAVCSNSPESRINSATSLPRRPHVVHAELRGVARPDGRRAVRAAELAGAWVVALELVVDARDARAGHAPAPVRL